MSWKQVVVIIIVGIIIYGDIPRRIKEVKKVIEVIREGGEKEQRGGSKKGDGGEL